MKPKIVDVWVAFNPETIKMDPSHRPFDRAFFSQLTANQYVASVADGGVALIVRRLDCEVPESDPNV